MKQIFFFPEIELSGNHIITEINHRALTDVQDFQKTIRQM
jgi:hypothetical protein